MRQRTLISVVTLLTLLLTPLSFAAGFGRLKISSALNEPLNAEIELLQVSPEDLPAMKARVASSELYREASLSRPGLADELKLTIEKRDDGRPVIHVTTTSQIVDSHFDVLVEVTWPAGRLIRDYAFDVNALKLTEVEMPASPRAPQVTETDAEPNGVTPPPAPVPEKARGVETQKDAGPLSSSPKTVKVKPGDTLAALAKRFKPDPVPLEQSMIAVFEANRRAFLRGNANLIRSGSVLEIPEGEAWTSMSNDKAREELRLMAEDFEAYKATLARATQSAPTQDAKEGEGAKGKIAGAAEDKTAPAPKGGQDVLRLSRQDLSKNDARAREDLQKEEAIVRENELKEARARAEALEKNVDAMKKLLDKKDAEDKVAPHQEKEKASAEPKPTVTPQVVLPEAMKPSLSSEEKETARADRANEETPKSGDTAEPKPVKKDVKKEKATGGLSTVLQHPVILLAALICLGLIGWLVFTLVRRMPRVGHEDYEESSSETSPQGTDTPSEDAVPPGAGAEGASATEATIPPREEVDPLDEAEVYIAYGRLAQAEEILLKAIAAHPGRLELLKKLMDIYAKETRKSDFEQSYKTMISLATPDNPLIGLCRKAGRDLDPMNPLYQDVQIVPPPIALNDLVPPIPGEVEKTPQTLADIDLSLSAAPASPPVEDETTPLAREMNTKLDLARAYIEIEDKDNAREILAEVAEKGTARQRAEAQALERELGA